MQSFKQPSRIIITCSKRLSIYLEQEVIQLGFKPVRTFATGVELRGTLNDCIRLNLNIRTASQILFSLKSFHANDAKDLYDELSTIQWENIIPADGYFAITSNVDTPSMRTELFANVKVKDAVADRMRSKTGSRPDSGHDLYNTVIHLFWKDSLAEIFIDTSGQTLSKHGYRKIPGQAPMLESLAAATVLATKWNRITSFVNPMCGSGTLAIEAACIASNRMPGLYRDNYGFMHIKGYDGDVYREEKSKLQNKIVEVSGVRIIATDHSQDAVNISGINAGIAGVESMIEFEVCDFEETKIPEENKGIVYFNPEYGERLGEHDELEETYSRIGNFMKQKCKGYTGYIFTGNMQLAKKIGLKANRKIEFYTSKIDCRLLEYDLYEGSKRIDTRVTMPDQKFNF